MTYTELTTKINKLQSNAKQLVDISQLSGDAAFSSREFANVIIMGLNSAIIDLIANYLSQENQPEATPSVIL